MRTRALLLMICLCFLSVEAQNKSAQLSNIPTVTFCELMRHPDLYDGKEIRFHANYISDFEVAALGNPDCAKDGKPTWAEFDRASIKASAKPEIYKKVEEQIFCCMWGGDNYIHMTKLLVTGIFHSAEKGYGHLNQYRFMVEVKNVEEIDRTEKIKVPGFDPK